MTTNPRDAIKAVLDEWMDVDVALELLAAAGFVVVACPPGGRVVVDRTEKPCPECIGNGTVLVDYDGAAPPWLKKCPTCDGRGVVEATTTYGLAPFVLGNPGPSFTAVALPEETPQ